jgi:hypothetical protein
MALPPTLADIAVLAGEEVILDFTSPEGEDWSTDEFYSQLRNSASNDAVLTSWVIEKETVSGATTVTMTLASDSEYGEEDGETRKLGSRAVFDVQRVDGITNKPIETLFSGAIVITLDVTR